MRRDANGESPADTLSAGQEVTDVDARLTKDGPQRALRHVAIMPRQRHLPAGAHVPPHFVAPGPIGST